MAAPGDGGEIIIKGSSVKVVYNGGIYPQDPANPNEHKNAKNKITRVVITDDNDDVVFDSGDHPDGLKWEITAFCK